MNGKKVIITKRFRKNVLHVYNYLIEEFSPATAYNFLALLEKRIDFIANNQQLVKTLPKEKISAVFCLHHTINFFIDIKMRPLKCYVSLICEKTLRKDLIKIELKRNAI